MRKQHVVNELVAAINNLPVNSDWMENLEALIDQALLVMERWDVTADEAAPLLLATGLLQPLQREAIVETMRELEVDREVSFCDWEDYGDHGDGDGYYGKQYYQNPRGKCEDAPCCGCCGMM